MSPEGRSPDAADQPEDSLEQVAREVRSCPKCRLCETRTKAVPGEGSPNAEVLFIGEGPGFNEDQQGRPFVGAAGRLLDEMIETVGLRRPEVFITNVVRCRPPGNRDPQPDEIAACDEYTLRQVALLNPKVIVTLGRFSMARFFGPKVKISVVHGQTTEWNGITCIALYHPAAVLRAQSPAMRQAYEDDFLKIPPLLERRRPRSLVAPQPDAPAASAPPSEEPALPAAEKAPRPDQLNLF